MHTEKMIRKPLTSFGQWQLLQLLGSGAFGEVHLWQNNDSGYQFVTKRLKANAKLKPDEISILHKRWLQEYKWMQNLRTSFIVGAVAIDDPAFLNYLQMQNNSETALPVIMMEYCNGGDLRQHLNQIHNLNGLTEFEVRSILFALLRATEYLHQECNIEHRDIKPENVVLHIKGNKKVFKLTDFGYAREIPESTIAQSVVGTRNYIAPEVIDPGIYTKTVDYWSIGTLAYEIICGIQPFIPHQTFVNRMKTIQRKPAQCIAIVQAAHDFASEQFEFIERVLPGNHLSCIFLHKMEEWLRLALDANYKTRGCNTKNNRMTFYTDLDNLLQSRIVTVFSLKTFRKHYYDIGSFENLAAFYNKICADNAIDIRKIFFISPPLHPKKHVQSPQDYFVSEWCDTTNTDNPPVMLFVTEYCIETDCDINIEKHFVISDTIKMCMGLSADNDSIESRMWLLQQFERDVHFILSECQHLLECYMMGLQNFAIEIDHEVYTHKDADTLFQRACQLSGNVRHSNVVLSEYLNIQRGGETAKAARETSSSFNKKCQELAKVVAPHLLDAHKGILQKCRELAKSEIYERYTKNDIFQLLKYRKFLSHNHSAAERLEYTQLVFDKCIQEFMRFTKFSEVKSLRASIRENISKFDFLRQKVIDVNVIISQLENEVENFTRSLIRNIANDNLSASMNSLHIDGPSLTNSVSSRRCSLADFEIDSQILIDECQNLCHVMETSMDLN